jgi:hypothetical protein
MTTESNRGHDDSEPDLPGESAAELNQRLRYVRAGTEAGPQSSGGEPSHQSPLLREVQFLEAAGSLGEASSVADWPRVGRFFSRIPLLGPVLAFGREVYGSVWLKAHRRSPTSQQITFNRTVARTLRTITWYFEDQDRLSSSLDHEIVAVRRDVGLADHDILMLRRRLDGLAQRLEVVSAEVESLRGAGNRDRKLEDV